MARITVEDLVVDSFFTDEGSVAVADMDILAVATRLGCICTGDISTCSRTSPQGGCDTSVQCVTG